MGQRVKRSLYPLGDVDLTKVIFRPVKRLKLIESWFPERFTNFIQCCKERILGHYALLAYCHYNILHCLL